MAPVKFVDLISQGRPIDVCGHGRMARDFIYIDDLVEAAVRLAGCVPTRDGRRRRSARACGRWSTGI